MRRTARRGRHRPRRLRRVLICLALAAAGLPVALLVVPSVLPSRAENSPSRAERTAWSRDGRPAGALNLALGRPATGGPSCTDQQTAAKALNGSIGGGPGDKWCAAGSVKRLTVDLGPGVRLTSLTVRHAEAGGEPADENTRDFDVQISEDGSTFRTIDRVRGNTRAVTTHAAKGPARFVRIIVLAGDRAGRGPARIYELEAYGVRRQAPATTRTCFGFPARDPMRGPHPTLPIDPDVPPLDEKYLTAARVLWQEQWPAAWQAFAPPRIAHDERQGIATVTVTTDASALLGGGSMSISYADIVDGVDRGELGGWLHDAARLLQTRYPGSGVPGLFSEGIPDFIRFAARGEDPAWQLVERRQLGAGAFDSQHVWSAGGRDGARFLLWVTQHYDSSGARYQLVHDLNTAVDSGALDYAGLFVTLTGRSYAQLFTEYAKDRVIMPHC